MKVRYYGHVGARSGYGVAARGMCRALIEAGVELEIRPLERRVELAVVDDGCDAILLAPHLRAPADLSRPDVVIVHTMPADCEKVLSVACRDEGAPEGVGAVAYTTWEAISPAPLPIKEGIGLLFDQVWSPSSASAGGFAVNWDLEARHPVAPGGTPIHTVPHAFDPELLGRAPSRDREGMMAGQPYRFLYVGAWTSRKNPAGLIRAFAFADFEPNEAELWIQSTGTPRETFGVALHQTGCVDDRLARVRFFNEPLSAMAMREQYRNADCFVTASRGEAWNLPAFEALLERCHIIAPGREGSDTFLEETSAHLVMDGMTMPAGVDVRITGQTPAGDGVYIETIGAQGLSSRCLWWEPDLAELACAMRAAVEQTKRELTVHYDPVDRFSYGAVGELALKHLEKL